MDFSNVNFLAVIVSGIAAWVIGALLVQPLTFQ